MRQHSQNIDYVLSVHGAKKFSVKGKNDKTALHENKIRYYESHYLDFLSRVPIAPAFFSFSICICRSSL